jgi:pimeloyl-ACP methyl ester carboxylesterase
MEPSLKTVDVRGHDLHLRQSGQGESLLYLHAARDVGMWTRTLDKLSQTFQVFAPQHPGFGDSAKLDWIKTVDDMVFYYTDFLDTMGIDQVHIMGGSIGGWIAAEFAVRHPLRVKSLILVGAAGIRVKGHPYADIFALNPGNLKSLAFYRPELAPVLSAEEQDKRVRDRRMLAQLAWAPRLFNPKLEERLFRVNVPTLIVWGSHDGIAPRAVGERYASLIPGAQMKIIEECGHTPSVEKPLELAQEVERFLTEQTKGATQ